MTVTRYKRNVRGQIDAWEFQQAEQAPTGPEWSADPKNVPAYVPPALPKKAAPPIEPSPVVIEAVGAATVGETEPLPQFLTKKPGRKAKQTEAAQ